MVFQKFNLFPHMTVMDNLTLAPTIVRHESRKKPWKMQKSTWTRWAC